MIKLQITREFGDAKALLAFSGEHHFNFNWLNEHFGIDILMPGAEPVTPDSAGGVHTTSGATLPTLPEQPPAPPQGGDLTPEEDARIEEILEASPPPAPPVEPALAAPQTWSCEPFPRKCPPEWLTLVNAQLAKWESFCLQDITGNVTRSSHQFEIQSLSNWLKNHPRLTTGFIRGVNGKGRRYAYYPLRWKDGKQIIAPAPDNGRQLPDDIIAEVYGK